VAGVIDKLGEDVNHLQVGQRVGVGWHGGHCFTCTHCRRGHFLSCDAAGICGISYDGGYAEYLVCPWEALASIPDDLSDVDAAPLLCAGVTTYNSMRNSGARPGDLVAIQGVGGLGHLAIQFASRMGFKVVALSRGADKKELAMQLGAHIYIDGKTQNVVEELQKLGGADLVVGTAPSGKAMTEVINGLSPRGKLLFIAASQDPIELDIGMLSGKMVHGWPSGTSVDSEDTMKFASMQSVKPMIEVFPLEQVNEAFAKVMDASIRFRGVLQISE